MGKEDSQKKHSASEENELTKSDIEKMSLMNDAFFAAAIDGNVELAEVILKPFLDLIGIRGNRILWVKSQYDINNYLKHSVSLDSMAEDESGKQISVDVQRYNEPGGGLPQRMRFYVASKTVKSLGKGEEYAALPDQVLIFITDKDYLKTGKSVEVYEMTGKATGEALGEGSWIIVANTEVFDGENPDVDLILSEIRQTNPKLLKNKKIKEVHDYLKQTEDGIEKVKEANVKAVEQVETELAAVSQQLATVSQQLAAVSQQLTTTSEQLAVEKEQKTKIAESLKSIVKDFREENLDGQEIIFRIMQIIGII